MAEPKAALALIEAAMASGAGLAVVPIQDYLGLGSEARVNTPGTIKGNWTWQMPQGTLTRELCGDIMKISISDGSTKNKSVELQRSELNMTVVLGGRIG